MHEFEKKVVKFFSYPKSEFLDCLSYTISCVPLLIIAWAIIGIFIIIRDSLVGFFVCFGLAIVFSIHIFISEIILKRWLKVKRLRPCKAYSKEIKAIGKSNLDSTSFPSSHVSGLVGGLFVLTYFYEMILPFSIIAVIIMAWSRLRNGMHYPTDILAGIILGLFYGYLALIILRIF